MLRKKEEKISYFKGVNFGVFGCSFLWSRLVEREIKFQLESCKNVLKGVFGCKDL